MLSENLKIYVAQLFWAFRGATSYPIDDFDLDNWNALIMTVTLKPKRTAWLCSWKSYGYLKNEFIQIFESS